jgi:hypothetical protein
MFDWSNFTYYPHHEQGRPDLYAFRQAMLVRLNQAESAFAALKVDNRTGAAGTDRPRIAFSPPTSRCCRSRTSDAPHS